MEEKANTGDPSSPCNSQKTISDDDEIEYSVKPEFYDSELDDKDETWIGKQRKGRSTDAVLTCPACFTTLCLECQRHETYVTQYRAILVTNCEVDPGKVLQEGQKQQAAREREDVEVTMKRPLLLLKRLTLSLVPYVQLKWVSLTRMRCTTSSMSSQARLKAFTTFPLRCHAI